MSVRQIPQTQTASAHRCVAAAAPRAGFSADVAQRGGSPCMCLCASTCACVLVAPHVCMGLCVHVCERVHAHVRCCSCFRRVACPRHLRRPRKWSCEHTTKQLSGGRHSRYWALAWASLCGEKSCPTYVESGRHDGRHGCKARGHHGCKVSGRHGCKVSSHHGCKVSRPRPRQSPGFHGGSWRLKAAHGHHGRPRPCQSPGAHGGDSRPRASP